MGRIKSLNKWANRHHYLPLDLLRIALGIFLFAKGINFMSDSQTLMDLYKPMESLFGGMIAVHYVAPAHFIGGILIAFGLLTRWAIIAQLPILIGAIIISLIGEIDTSNLILAVLVFLVCIFFLLYGSGKYSADYYFKMQQ